MTRTEGINFPLNKPEVRLLHNIIQEWLENHEDTNDLEYDMAYDIANELYARWKS